MKTNLGIMRDLGSNVQAVENVVGALQATYG